MLLHIITSIQIISPISLDEVINGLVVVCHPCSLTDPLQLRVLGFVEMDTAGRFVMAEVAQIDRHTVCIGSLAVFTTEDVMLLRLSKPLADVAHTLPVTFDDALTHIHTPMWESPILRRSAR